METVAQPLDNTENKPAWETPELTIETVASRTQNGVTMTFVDGGSGS